MSRESSATRNTLWTALAAVLAVGALACWVIAFGVAWRAWILVGSEFGIIAHVDASGQQASTWGIVGSILWLAAIVTAIAAAAFRRFDHATTAPVDAVVVEDIVPTTDE